MVLIDTIDICYHQYGLVHSHGGTPLTNQPWALYVGKPLVTWGHAIDLDKLWQTRIIDFWSPDVIGWHLWISLVLPLEVMNCLGDQQPTNVSQHGTSARWMRKLQDSQKVQDSCCVQPQSFWTMSLGWWVVGSLLHRNLESPNSPSLSLCTAATLLETMTQTQTHPVQGPSCWIQDLLMASDAECQSLLSADASPVATESAPAPAPAAAVNPFAAPPPAATGNPFQKTKFAQLSPKVGTRDLKGPECGNCCPNVSCRFAITSLAMMRMLMTELIHWL